MNRAMDERSPLLAEDDRPLPVNAEADLALNGATEQRINIEVKKVPAFEVAANQVQVPDTNDVRVLFIDTQQKKYYFLLFELVILRIRCIQESLMTF